MYQRLVLVGRLGRDPEMRYTPQGTPVTSFPVATSRRYNTADGQQKEETVWFRVSVWGKQAETVNQYINKGSKVLIEGTLVGDENGGPRVWTDREGKPRASFEVRAYTVRFLDSKREAAGGGQPGNGNSALPDAGGEEPTLSEDLPF
jgi:single-strand DNA-binding protein